MVLVLYVLLLARSADWPGGVEKASSKSGAFPRLPPAVAARGESCVGESAAGVEARENLVCNVVDAAAIKVGAPRRSVDSAALPPGGEEPRSVPEEVLCKPRGPPVLG